MKTQCLIVSHAKKAWYKQAVEHYSTRMPQVKNCYIPPSKHSQPDKIRIDETKRLLGKIQAKDFVLILDTQAPVCSEKKLYTLFTDCSQQGFGLTICIGGAWGYDHRLLDNLKNTKLLSLMGFTMTHLLCHVFILEQLYRYFSLQQQHPFAK